MHKLLTKLGFTSLPYSDEIQKKLQDLLYTNFLRSSFVIILISVFLTYALWESVTHLALLSWLSSLLLVTLFRLFDARLFFKNRMKHDYDYWQQHFTLGVLFSALVWAMLPYLFFSATEHQTNFFIAFVVFP